MKIIYLNKQEGIKTLLYPDNQPHVNIQDVNEDDEVGVVASLTSSQVVLELLETANALDNLFAKKKVLTIPYLMGARFDRLMQHGDSIDLKVIANLINMCGFEKVILFDPHSDVSPMLINNSAVRTNQFLVESYNIPDTVLICPDAGAAKKIGKYLEWNDNIVDVVYCTKTRNLSNGKLTISVLEPEKCDGKNCLIIDDICDGGGTFIGIANQVNAKHMTLMVSHGIFSQGFAQLKELFDHIVTTNSRYQTNNENFVTTIKAF